MLAQPASMVQLKARAHATPATIRTVFFTVFLLFARFGLHASEGLPLSAPREPERKGQNQDQSLVVKPVCNKKGRSPGLRLQPNPPSRLLSGWVHIPWIRPLSAYSDEFAQAFHLLPFSPNGLTCLAPFCCANDTGLLINKQLLVFWRLAFAAVCVTVCVKA